MVSGATIRSARPVTSSPINPEIIVIFFKNIIFFFNWGDCDVDSDKDDVDCFWPKLTGPFLLPCNIISLEAPVMAALVTINIVISIILFIVSYGRAC